VVRDLVKDFFASTSGSNNPILIMDDGGALIDAVASYMFDHSIIRHVIAIEQTQHGLHAAKPSIARTQRVSGSLTVINVAQSLSKLVIESSMIADSVLEASMSWVDFLSSHALSVGSHSPLRIGVIGYGSIGESVARRIRELPLNYGQLSGDVPIFDINPNKLAAASRSDFTVTGSVNELLESVDIVIAATGGSSLNHASPEVLANGTLLCSASSGNLEFSALVDWESKRLGFFDPELSSPFDYSHGLIILRGPSGRVLFVANAGFPVNFTGGAEIEGDRIQLTRALMIAGVMQAARIWKDTGSLGDKAGIWNLDHDLDTTLGRDFNRLASTEGSKKSIAVTPEKLTTRLLS
jgi:hypothetical protein